MRAVVVRGFLLSSALLFGACGASERKHEPGGANAGKGGDASGGAGGTGMLGGTGGILAGGRNSVGGSGNAGMGAGGAAGAGSPNGGAGAGGAAGSPGTGGSGAEAGQSAGDAGMGGQGAGGSPAGPLTCVQEVAVGQGYVCATNQEGALYCWGVNTSGQLGTGDMNDRATPALVTGLDAPVVHVAAGYTTFAITETGNVYQWGSIELVTRRETAVRPQRYSYLPMATTIEPGGTFRCALNSDTTVDCWGSNNAYQLGDGTAAYHVDPAPVSMLSSVVELSAGYWHTCAVRDDAMLLCWGGNDLGQLGSGTLDDALVPVEVTALGANVLHVATDGEYTCALLEDATVSCWGRVGYADNVGDPNPTPVQGLGDVIAIALGTWHQCALKDDGSLWCWHNSLVSTGTTPPVPSETPAPIAELGNDVVRVVAAGEDTCAVRSNGSLWCFGTGYFDTTPVEVVPGCE
jgi:alpha-tubulin suppressor-like RCC1 family protein